MNLKSQNWSNCILFAKFKISHVKSMIQLLCNPMDSSPPGTSVLGISQVRILEWVAISSSRGPSWPRDTLPASTGRFFTAEPSRKHSFSSHDAVTVFFLILKPGDLGHPALSYLRLHFKMLQFSSAGGLISWEDEVISLSSNPLSFTEPFAPLFSFISP